MESVDTHLSDPTLAAGRFRVRPFVLTDAPLVIDAARDADLRRRCALPVEPARGDAHEYIRRQWQRSLSGEAFSLAIAEAGTDRATGQVSLELTDLTNNRGALDCWVEPEFRRRGAASSALAVMSHWGFSMLAMRRLEVVIAPDNGAAAGLIKSVGFQREGTLRSWWLTDERPADAVLYSLLPEELVIPE